MQAIPYEKLRENLVKTMERVCDSHEPYIVTREGGRSVIMMSLEDYNGTEKTAHLYAQEKVQKEKPVEV